MNPNFSGERRKDYYVDHLMQKWLLVALVVLECTLTALAVGGMYLALDRIMDRYLRSVHLSPDANMLRDFFIDGAKILAVMGVANFAAILLADRIWAVYVRSIVRGIDKVMLAAQRLDLTAQGVRRTHAVLDRLLRWQRGEGLRLRRIRHAVRHLPETLPDAPEDRSAAAAHLRIIQDRGAHALGE